MILITGGLGYLGARIANYLINSEKKVLLGIRSNTNIIPDELKGCEICIFDMADKASLRKACNRVDAIIHLAGMNSEDCNLDPEKAILINSKGTLDLLNAAKESKVKNFIYFSTAHVYRSPLTGFMNEKSQVNPSHSYSISNQIAENYVLAASDDKNLNCTIFRLSNAVGRPLNKGTNCWSLVTNDLCKSVICNRKMQLNSNRHSKRDFISINDICRVVLFFLERQLFLSNTEIYNLSSGDSVSLESLTKLIVSRTTKILGFTPEVVFSSTETKGASSDLEISNKKLKKLGFNISGSIIDEIDDLLIHCNTWYQ